MPGHPCDKVSGETSGLLRWLGTQGRLSAVLLTAFCSLSFLRGVSSVVPSGVSQSLSARNHLSHDVLSRLSLGPLSGGGGTLERPKHMELKSPITYITDCQDQNGKGRSVAKLRSQPRYLSAYDFQPPP